MDKNIIDSSLTNSDNNAEFDIRNLMNYDLIKRSLIRHPTELSLLEITCILINKTLRNDSNNDNILSK
jgi:hypothetical protein